MVLLTVIGKRLAKKGVVFTFRGPLSNCRECKVKNICFHLTKGKKYRIISARDIVHECPEHEEGVLVVEVEEVPFETTVPKKRALEGSTVTLELPKCSERGCEFYRLCFPMAMDSGQKIVVSKILGNIDCPAGHDRVRILLG